MNFVFARSLVTPCQLVVLMSLILPAACRLAGVCSGTGSHAYSHSLGLDSRLKARETGVGEHLPYPELPQCPRVPERSFAKTGWLAPKRPLENNHDVYWPATVSGHFKSTFCSQSETASEEPIEVVGVVNVPPKTPGASVFPDQRIDLGEVESGKKYLLKVRLQNSSGEPLIFRRVGASCACVNLRVPKGDVPVGATLDVEALVSIPSQQEAEVFLVGIDFYSDEAGRDEAPFLRVRVQSTKIRGLICFGAIPGTLQVGRGLGQLSLPVTVSDPIDPATLVIDKSDTLRDAVLTVKSDGNTEIMCIDVSGVLLDDGFRECWIRIRDPASDRSAEASFFLEKTPLASVRPSLISLTRDPDSAGWRGVLFLVVDNEALEEAEKETAEGDNLMALTESSMTANARINEHTIPLNLKPIRSGIYRFELKVPAAVIGDSNDGTVIWFIEYGSFEHKFNSLWRVAQ